MFHDNFFIVGVLQQRNLIWRAIINTDVLRYLIGLARHIFLEKIPCKYGISGRIFSVRRANEVCVLILQFVGKLETILEFTKQRALDMEDQSNANFACFIVRFFFFRKELVQRHNATLYLLSHFSSVISENISCRNCSVHTGFVLCEFAP